MIPPARLSFLNRIAALVCAAAFLSTPACFLKKKTPPEFYPYENLLTIVADCQRFLKTDVYQYPYPVDLSGQNIFKTSLIRLANYEHLYPGRFSEIIAWVRGRLYLHLGDYAMALHNFQIVAAMKGDLAPLAEEAITTAEAFRTITEFSVQAETPAEYLQEFDARIEALRQLAGKLNGSDTGPLALLELEKAEVDRAVFLQDNRHLIPDGTTRALDAWRGIIETHAASKKIQSHRLHIADFFFALAREYASWKPPERIGFEWKVFESYAVAGRDMYYRVSIEDGYSEKLEARGKLEAILAFMDAVREASR